METGCAFNSQSVCRSKRPVGFANHDPPKKPNKTNGQGRRKTRNGDAKQKEREMRRKKQKIRKWEVKKRGKIMQMGERRKKKEQLAKLEK